MTANLTIAGHSNVRLVSWKKRLNDIVSTTLEVDSLGRLDSEMEKINSDVLLLDSDLIVANSFAFLRSLSARTKTIVIGDALSKDMEWQYIKTGVRGCCHSDSNPRLLSRIVWAVYNGELWIRRMHTSRLIDELENAASIEKPDRASLGKLDTLTPREYDVALRIRNGESNKAIAQSCSITERTVKAHLTEVFLKLGVSNRLNLALAISRDEVKRPADFSETEDLLNV